MIEESPLITGRQPSIQAVGPEVLPEKIDPDVLSDMYSNYQKFEAIVTKYNELVRFVRGRLVAGKQDYRDR